MPPRYAHEPRFVADAMLARLARWLRVLGYDTAFDPPVHDPELVRLAASESRILLTRDRHLILHLRPRHGLLITATAPLAQLQEVVDRCRLDLPRKLFTRCLICNTLLRSATALEAAELLPERARSGDDPVLRCDHCGRMYWPGSHVRRMRAALAATFPGFDWWGSGENH